MAGDEIGDLLFSVTNLARHFGIDPRLERPSALVDEPAELVHLARQELRKQAEIKIAEQIFNDVVELTGATRSDAVLRACGDDAGEPKHAVGHLEQNLAHRDIP